MVNIGYDNYIDINKIICIADKNSAPIKRLVQNARNLSILIDVSQGKPVKSVIFMNDGHVCLSILPPYSIANKTGTFRAVGYDCYVRKEEISLVIGPTTSPIKRLINETKEINKVIDVTYGRTTRSAIITNDNFIILTAKNTRTLAGNISEQDNKLNELKKNS